MGYILTEEGKKYLKEGFPEMRLIEEISKGEISFEKAKDMEGFNIALQWAKKNNWIRIESGIIKLSEEGKAAITENKSGLEAALGCPDEASEDDLDILLKRSLVRKESGISDELESLKGKEVLSLTPNLIKSGVWREVTFRPYDAQFTGKKFYPGKRHPYRNFLRQLKEKLVLMGFKEMEPRFIVPDFWNCDALFMPQTHSAREIHDIFMVDAALPPIDKNLAKKVGDEHEASWNYKWSLERANKCVLMSQGTALSAMQLLNLDIPGKYFSLAKVFRPDVVDATHLLEFFQLEGIVCDKSMNFRHLLGLLKSFAQDIAGAQEVKFYPDYYPFTEPSVQISAKHPDLGWVELGGAGIFRKEVTRPFGIEEPIIAWGVGIDRLAMFNLGISDIRELYSANLKWLRENYYYAKN
jgi:phenylalanyl-tRNA synthetase alpha chain